jgi:hypothetical protein
MIAQIKMSSKALYELLNGNQKVKLEQVELLIEQGAKHNELPHNTTAFDLCWINNSERVPQDVLDYLFKKGCTFRTDNGREVYDNLLKKSLKQVKDNYRKTVDAARIPDENISKRIRESIWGPTGFQQNRNELIKDVETLLNHLKSMKDTPSTSSSDFNHFNSLMQNIHYANHYLEPLPGVNETDALSELVDRGLDINYSDALETAISVKNVAYFKRILETTGCKVGLYHLFLLCQPIARYTSDESQDFLSIFQLLVDHLTHDDTNEKFKGLPFNQYLQNFKYSKALKIWEQKFPTINSSSS